MCVCWGGGHGCHPTPTPTNTPARALVRIATTSGGGGCRATRSDPAEIADLRTYTSASTSALCVRARVRESEREREREKGGFVLFFRLETATLRTYTPRLHQRPAGVSLKFHSSSHLATHNNPSPHNASLSACPLTIFSPPAVAPPARPPCRVLAWKPEVAPSGSSGGPKQSLTR